MRWLSARVERIVRETPTATTLVLDVPEWPGNAAGQHIDVRLTAEDGYTAVRSYSLASAPGETAAITIEELPDGEVSPYLVHEVGVGDLIEVRGPIGGYFVWTPADPRPVQLIAGGSGVVPLFVMLRAHAAAGTASPMQLLYSVRTPRDVYYADALAPYVGAGVVDVVYTREGPVGAPGPGAGRITTERLAASVLPPDALAYVCGPTGFVESIASWLVDLGYDPAAVRTERFGGA